ncbi:MAG: PEP-CTERM system TPR-repeat protein PrsT [Rhodobacteraceae bacterium]|nr:PEP-CTERM system TPR-repeat protein PrsT [Paracoccaceae bacterium]
MTRDTKAAITPHGRLSIQPLLRSAMLATCAWAAISLAAPPAWAAPTSESLRFMEDAKEHLEDGDTAAAIIELKNAVRVDPDNSEARVQLGELYLRTGDAASAQREFESARARGYDESKIVMPLSQSYYMQGKFSEVIKNFDPSAFEGDARRGIMIAQARSHIALQDVDKARPLIDEVLGESPDYPAALAAHAIILRFDGKLPEAESEIDKALKIEPGQLEILVLKGELRQQQQDLEGALSYFDKAVEVNPRYTRARVARAMANLAANKPDVISADVDETLRLEPQNPLALYLRAFLLSRDTKYKDATQILLTLPALLEGYPPARYLLAASAFADNQLEVALTYADLYVSRVPQDPGGAKLLAAIHQRMNAPAKAVPLLEPLVAANPDDAQLKLQLATALLGVGRSDEAINLFEQGVAANPENSEARLALAVSQIRSGATEAGLTELQRVIDEKPTSVEANSILILTYLQNRNIDRAIAAAKAMVAADDKDANAYNLLGTVNLAAQDFAEARRNFQTALDRDPKYVAAPLNLARVEERDGKPEEARKWYEQALEIDSKNLTAFDGLTNLALADGKFEDAEILLERAIQLNPETPAPRLKLIGMMLERQQNDRALIAARNFVNAAPNDPQALDALARSQLATGDTVNAVGSYEQLAAKFPQNPEPQRRLARVYLAAERKTDAVKAMDAAVELAPDYQAALVDRLAYERDERGIEAALDMAQRMVNERPDSLTRLVVYGDLQGVAASNEAALATYRRAWDKAQNPALLQRLYAAYTRLNRGEEGLAMLKDWVAKNPNDFDTRFLITSHYINTGDYDAAIRETEGMDGALPDNPVLLNNLAWLYGEKDNPRAFEIAEKAFRLAPQTADIVDTLGWLNWTKGDKDRGLELLKTAHELQPQRPEIGYHYAQALKARGDNATAKDVLQKSLQNGTRFAEREQAEELLKELGG